MTANKVANYFIYNSNYFFTLVQMTSDSESEAHKQATVKEVSQDRSTSMSSAIYDSPIQEVSISG